SAAELFIDAPNDSVAPLSSFSDSCVVSLDMMFISRFIRSTALLNMTEDNACSAAKCSISRCRIFSEKTSSGLTDAPVAGSGNSVRRNKVSVRYFLIMLTRLETPPASSPSPEHGHSHPENGRYHPLRGTRRSAPRLWSRE